jgi:hypothetical protein
MRGSSGRLSAKRSINDCGDLAQAMDLLRQA